MTTYYSPEDVARLVGRTSGTVKLWTADPDYGRFISPTGNPPKGMRRAYTVDDLQVISLIADRLNRGFSHADIAAQLMAGMREEIPPGVADLAPTAPAAELARLEGMVADLRIQLRAAQDDRTGAVAQVDLLQRQLRAAQDELKAALLDLGAARAELRRKP